MQQMSGLGLIDRVLAPHGVAAAMAGPPSYVVHPTAVLLVPNTGIVMDLCSMHPCNEHVQRSGSTTRARDSPCCPGHATMFLQMVVSLWRRPSTYRRPMGWTTFGTTCRSWRVMTQPMLACGPLPPSARSVQVLTQLRNHVELACCISLIRMVPVRFDAG